MKIRKVENKQKWEEFISRSAPQSFFQSFNWGETIRKIKDKREKIKDDFLWRLGLYKKSKLIGVAQVEKVEARRGSFFHIRHGPVFSVWKKEYLDFLLNFLEKLARSQKVSFIRISPLISDTRDYQKMLENAGFYDAPIPDVDAVLCQVVDLTQSLEKILRQMRKTTRHSIKKAQNAGVKIEKSGDSKDIDEFLKLYKQTASRQNFVRHKGIKEEFEIFSRDGQISLFKAYYQNTLYAAALIVFYNHQAIYHHSASIPHRIPINHALQWEVIKEAKKRGKKVYNLFGIAPEKAKRHPWRGLTIFKKGFGGEQVKYLHPKDLPLSFWYYKTYLVEYWRKIRKGY